MGGVSFDPTAIEAIEASTQPADLGYGLCGRCKKKRYCCQPFKVPEASRVQFLCPLCVAVLQLRKKPDLSFAL